MKAMKRFFMAADAVKVPRGSVSIVRQRQVEGAIGGNPLSGDETRGIEGEPNLFISAHEYHHGRKHAEVTVVNGFTVFIHMVPTEDAPCEPLWLPRIPENSILVSQASHV